MALVHARIVLLAEIEAGLLRIVEHTTVRASVDFVVELIAANEVFAAVVGNGVLDVGTNAVAGDRCCKSQTMVVAKRRSEASQPT